MRGGVDHHGTPPHAGDRARLRVDRGDGRVGARPDDGPRRLGIAVFVEVGDPVRQRPVADEYRVEDRLVLRDATPCCTPRSTQAASAAAPSRTREDRFIVALTLPMTSENGKTSRAFASPK